MLWGKFVHVWPKSMADVADAVSCPPGQSVISKKHVVSEALVNPAVSAAATEAREPPAITMSQSAIVSCTTATIWPIDLVSTSWKYY